MYTKSYRITQPPKPVDLGWAELMVLAIVGATQDMEGVTADDQERIASAAVNVARMYIPNTEPESLLED